MAVAALFKMTMMMGLKCIDGDIKKIKRLTNDDGYSLTALVIKDDDDDEGPFVIQNT